MDRWEGVINHEEVVELPTAHVLERVLEQLDAKTYTIIVLEGEGEVHMALGGGGGHYVVYATFDNMTFWNLLRSDPVPDGRVMINVGGQEGDYPEAQVVPKELALRAALTFLETGKLNPTLQWKEAQ